MSRRAGDNMHHILEKIRQGIVETALILDMIVIKNKLIIRCYGMV